MPAQVARWSVLRILAQACAIFVAVFIGATVGTKLLAPTPFDPLTFPLQTVIEHPAGATGPAQVPVGHDVHVLASKCSKVRTSVTSRSAWVTVDPPGSSIARPGGSATYPGPGATNANGQTADAFGCIRTYFDNPMPPGVTARTRDLFSEGYRSVIWVIAGTETPTHPHAVAKTWQTEPITVTP